MKATVPDIAVFRDLLSKYRKDELLSRRSDIDPSVHPDHFDAVIAELDRRFPGWDNENVAGKMHSGTTRVTFRLHEKVCEHQIDALVWLVDHFVSAAPHVLEEGDDWIGTQGKIFFARSLDALFDGHPDHKQDGAKWRRLDNGWYMNAVLSEGAKLEMLKRFSRLAGFEEGAWTWNDKAAPPEYVDFF